MGAQEESRGTPQLLHSKGAAFYSVSSHRQLLLQNYTKTLFRQMEALPLGVFVCLPFTGDCREGMMEKPGLVV